MSAGKCTNFNLAVRPSNVQNLVTPSFLPHHIGRYRPCSSYSSFQRCSPTKTLKYKYGHVPQVPCGGMHRQFRRCLCADLQRAADGKIFGLSSCPWVSFAVFEWIESFSCMFPIHNQYYRRCLSVIFAVRWAWQIMMWQNVA